MQIGFAKLAARLPGGTVEHERMRIDLGFPAEKSISDWERRHDAGQVPGRWPYGLEGLSALADVRAVTLAQPTSLQRALGRLGVRHRATDSAIGLTWDENSALRMAITDRHARHVSGVIWLTDAAARGRDLGRMPSVLSSLSAAWVLSEAQIEPLQRLLPSVPVEYVRFGIDGDFFRLRPAPEAPRIVSVGGDRDRDTETLFRALARVHELRPDVELIVQTASELASPEGVRTIRHLPHTELRDLYASASVVAIATRENLHVSGMTVSLEAMATGRPVVITRSPGMEDYVADGVTGLLAPTGDDQKLAEHLLALLADEDGAQAMGRAGRTAVESRFTSAGMSGIIGAAVRRHA